MLAYLSYALGGWLSGRLPRRVGLAITAFIAVLFRISHPGVVRVVESNLRRIEDALGRPFDPLSVPATFDHFARSVYEFVSLPHRSTTEILERFCVVQGEEHLQRVSQRSNGLLVVSAHLAGWEMGGAWLASKLGPFHTAAMDHPSPRVTDYFSRRRQKRGIHVHPLGNAFRPLLAALDNGEVVAVLADRGFGGSGSKASFFGREATMPTGYLRLASASGATVLPMFARRVGSITEIRVEEPFEVSEEYEEEGLATMLSHLERHIGAAPEQWARFTPVWRHG